MLKKNQVLKGEKNFENIFKTTRPFYFNHLKIRSADNRESGVKIGIIVSSKVSKKAVERNRLKRQLRAIFKSLIDQNKLKDQTVVITVIKKPEPSQARLLLEKEIEEWLKRSFSK